MQMLWNATEDVGITLYCMKIGHFLYPLTTLHGHKQNFISGVVLLNRSRVLFIENFGAVYYDA